MRPRRTRTEGSREDESERLLFGKIEDSTSLATGSMSGASAMPTKAPATSVTASAILASRPMAG